MILIHVDRMILLESRKSFGQLHHQMKLTQRDMKGSQFISPLTSNPVLYIVFFVIFNFVFFVTLWLK
jgi:hypothetical protein